MPRVASLLLKGSTLLTQRTILTFSIPTAPLGLLAIQRTISILSVRRNKPINGLSPIRAPVTVRYFVDTPRSRTRRVPYNSEVMTALTMKKCVVVGISGVTNGGKTTLCEQLERDMPMATHINMDHYFHDEESGHIPIVKELNHGNYEDPRAINFDQMVKDVDRWVTEASQNPINGRPQILFLEGILILNHKPLVPYYSLKYFLTLTKEQCWDRRKHRKYDPPDPPNYFDYVVWPMYLKNRAQLNDQRDIVYIDGMDDRDVTYKRVLTDLKAKLDQT